MTPQERVARLESLLERVKKNAALPRPVAGAPIAAKSAPEQKPVSRPFAAPAPEPKLASDSLAASAAVTLEPPFLEPATLPPAPRAEPFALSAESPAPPAEPFAPLTPAPAWTAEPPSAVQPRPGTLPPDELSEDDLIDMTTLPPAPVGPAPPIDVAASAPGEPDFEEDEEQPPASSRRSRVAESLDDALVSATQLDQEEEREVPVKTPPPESGPQEALPSGLDAPGIPDVDTLEADLLGPPSLGPTAEQLGETIELDEPLGPQLEIDVAASAASVPEPERPPEELEVTLPRGPLPSGTYDVEPPPSVDIHVADADLPPISLQVIPQELIPTLSAGLDVPGERGPERTARPPHGATDVARVVLAPITSSKNFVELLDVSLGL